MALSAFHGRAELREAALARLAANIEAGRLSNGPLVWNAQRGSVVGCLIESADTQQWVNLLGLPKWLAHALDASLGNASPAKVLGRATALLSTLPLGADVGPVGSRLVCGMLDDAWTGIDASQRPPALGEVVCAIKVLHVRCVRGDAPTGAEWRGLRQRAMAVTDVLQEARQQAVAGCAEAAGWDPQTSPTVVSDVLRQWAKLQLVNADAEFGWTQADHEQIRQLLGALHAEHLADKPDDARTVFDLLELHHAAVATRLRAHIRFEQEQHAAVAERAADLLIRLIEVRDA